MAFRMTEHGKVPFTQEEVRNLEEARTKWQNRKQLLKTKDGMMKKPALWNHERQGRLIVKRKYGLTDSDEEEDANEIHSFEIDYTDLRGNITEQELNEAIAYYRKQDAIRALAQSEKEKAAAKLKENAEFLKRRQDPVDIFPVGQAIELMRHVNPQIRKKAKNSMPELLPTKRKYDYYLMLNESDDETERENELYTDISYETQKLWQITPVWRLYTFGFKRSLIGENCPKLLTEFDRESIGRWMDSIPMVDVPKGNLTIYTRRVKRFQIHGNWHLLLNNRSRIEEHEIAAGDGMHRFLESTSRRQRDKWTPNYQSVTLMTQTVSEDLDPMNQDPVIFRMYCLVARENCGRDVDSKAYMLVRPQYFDKNVEIVNESLKEDTLKIWITRMAREKKGRTFCGSTDFRITTCVKEVQEILENKNS